jgi:hypothetical protein
LRLAIQADEGYVSLTLTDQDLKDDVTLTQEGLTFGKQKPYVENYQILYRKITWTKSSPHCGLPQSIPIRGRKVVQSPFKTGLLKPEAMRSSV